MRGTPFSEGRGSYTAVRDRPSRRPISGRIGGRPVVVVRAAVPRGRRATEPGHEDLRPIRTHRQGHGLIVVADRTVVLVHPLLASVRGVVGKRGVVVVLIGGLRM